MISNSEFAQLNYLCIHLVRSPNEWRRMFSIIDDRKLSAQMQCALDLFKKELNKLSTPSMKDLREISERFIKFDDDNVSDMGKAIATGIDWLGGRGKEVGKEIGIE